MNRRLFASSAPARRTVTALGLAATLAISACGRSSSGPAASSAPAAVSADTWATVNGTNITRAEVDKAFQRLGDNRQGLSEEETLAAKLGVLDELIIEEVLLEKAKQANVQVPDAEVDTAYNEAKKNITDEQFQQQLTQRNLTAADMREGLRRQLVSQKLLENQVTSKVTVTDQQVIDFFNANRAQFNLPEDAFHIAQIVVTPARDAQIANRTGDDATTPEAANAKVSMLMQRLQQGTPFGDLARDYSEDPESAPRGGDLGLVPISAVKSAPPALRDAVLKMEPGRARVVNQNGAATIVFVVAQEKAGQRDLSMPAVKDQITQTLKARREQLLRTAYLTAARADADVTNYLARRVVDAQGRATDIQSATAAAK
jgi:peptidyl-prolyl cis-trans isomerase SurA